MPYKWRRLYQKHEQILITIQIHIIYISFEKVMETMTFFLEHFGKVAKYEANANIRDSVINQRKRN